MQQYPEYSLVLGDTYRLGKVLFRVIKVTRKGFNLLNLKTSKCLLYPHLYAKGWGGKEIPANQKHFTFKVKLHTSRQVVLERAVNCGS